MTATTAERIRQWQGPALLTLGLRPFFLAGAAWALASMLLWIMALSGAVELPTRFDPTSWHVHSFMFGYLGAVIAGFLATAIPNWTGRLPVVGWPLAALVALWAAGRFAVLFSLHLPPLAVMGLDLAFPLAFTLLVLREIVAGRNWRNLPVLGLLAILVAANMIFHLEAMAGEDAARGLGFRLALASVLTMIALIGGRIVPSFTRNWLARRPGDIRPAPPMQRLDVAILLLGAVALLLWLVLPDRESTGHALVAAGLLHAWRLARWKGRHTTAEPLVAVLHLAYAFLPLGFVAVGLAILREDLVPMAAALHLWVAGAVGMMTLAVMTRAALGHTGHALHAGAATIAIYLAMAAAVILRFLAGYWPSEHLYHLAGLGWCAAFAIYLAAYGPILLRRRG